MSKGLEALDTLKDCYLEDGGYELINIIKKELKALEIIKDNFRLVGNCLHAKNSYAEDGWVFVKEIENEEELNAWKEVLL